MSIHPGYSGQQFMPSSVHRIRTLRAALPEGMPIQVDGGIEAGNVRTAFEAGATLFVAGSAIFGSEDPTRSYRQLVQALA
jgi:ribulose-phosphate 3-epimerase